MRPSKPPTPCSQRQLKRVGGEQLPKAEQALERMKRYPPRQKTSPCPQNATHQSSDIQVPN